MTRGELIGEGRTAEVFAWPEGRALKLFREGWGKADADHEHAIARRLFDAGAPVPAVHGVIVDEGRHGVLYERLVGPTLQSLVFAEPPRLETAGRMMAETHAAIHARTVPDLPTARARVERGIREARRLPEGLRAVALRALEEAPDGDALCHGDYHPLNVIVAREGARVIDWENACLGHPLADVARTELLLLMYPAYAQDPAGRAAVRERVPLLLESYFRNYRERSTADWAALDRWRLPVAAARLHEDIAIEEPLALARIRELASAYGWNPRPSAPSASSPHRAGGPSRTP